MDQAQQLVSPGDGRYGCSSYKEHLRTYHFVKIVALLERKRAIYFHMEIDCNCASHIPIAVHN